ncbi:MAG: pyrimidine reductase family protein [Mycolicibacterium sp.]|uniref:pyrimidine reductase family protein n=1 Tax=Mycolicibacterium sp. TaxID=2320850 RepID=UPI003D0E6275
MSADADGTQFTLLGGIESFGAPGLGRCYPYPDPLRSCWVRGNMITSIDGGATSGGKSGELGGPADRALFVALRELADVIVVGASTVRVENYSGVQFSAAQRRQRESRGQAEIPPVAVLTRSGQLARDAKLFTHTEVRPLILTSADAVDDTRVRLGTRAEVINASGVQTDAVDLRVALGLLAERGLLRVLTEGGPVVLGTFIEEDLLDEMCLTVAPTLVGGKPGRIVTGSAEMRTAMRFGHGLADQDGYLYLRYVRRDPPRVDAAQ